MVMTTPQSGGMFTDDHWDDDVVCDNDGAPHAQPRPVPLAVTAVTTRSQSSRIQTALAGHHKEQADVHVIVRGEV